MAESAKRAVTGYAVSTWGSQEKPGNGEDTCGTPNLFDGRAATQPQAIIFALGAADKGTRAHSLYRASVGCFRQRDRRGAP